MVEISELSTSMFLSKPSRIPVFEELEFQSEMFFLQSSLLLTLVDVYGIL